MCDSLRQATFTTSFTTTSVAAILDIERIVLLFALPMAWV